jgi:hypothetical protein
VDRDQAGLGDHLDVIGAATAHPRIAHRNQRDPVRRGLPDCRLGGVKQRQHPDIVAAIEGERDLSLAQRLHGSPRLLEVSAVRNVEDLGEAGIFIAAQRRIDDVIADDARLIVAISDAAQCALGQVTRLRDA